MNYTFGKNFPKRGDEPRPKKSSLKSQSVESSWGVLRSAVGMTHLLRSGLVMDYTISYFPLIVLGHPFDSKRKEKYLLFYGQKSCYKQEVRPVRFRMATSNSVNRLSYLSIEAQCVSHLLPLGDCHRGGGIKCCQFSFYVKNEKWPFKNQFLFSNWNRVWLAGNTRSGAGNRGISRVFNGLQDLKHSDIRLFMRGACVWVKERRDKFQGNLQELSFHYLLWVQIGLVPQLYKESYLICDSCVISITTALRTSKKLQATNLQQSQSDMLLHSICNILQHSATITTTHT